MTLIELAQQLDRQREVKAVPAYSSDDVFAMVDFVLLCNHEDVDWGNVQYALQSEIKPYREK